MKRAHRLVITYGLLTVIGIVMVYPLLWMISASFKTNREIFSSLSLMPTEILWDGYSKGWQSSGQYTFATYFVNTFVMVIPTVLLTVASSLPVAYGFARFRFKGKGVLFTLVIASLMLPTEVIIIPRYMLFNKLGWLNTYLPFIVPAAFATYSFFIFMLVQFTAGPRELDEAARIDGCGPWGTLVNIILPLCKPALVILRDFPVRVALERLFKSPDLHQQREKISPVPGPAHGSGRDGYGELEPDHGNVGSGNGSPGGPVLPLPEILCGRRGQHGTERMMEMDGQNRSFEVRALELHSQYAWELQLDHQHHEFYEGFRFQHPGSPPQ